MPLERAAFLFNLCLFLPLAAPFVIVGDWPYGPKFYFKVQIVGSPIVVFEFSLCIFQHAAIENWWEAMARSHVQKSGILATFPKPTVPALLFHAALLNLESTF